MTVDYIDAIKERYERLGYEPYRWYRARDMPPWAPLKKLISESRLGVLSTSGAYVAGQVAYHYKDDTSIRAIPKAAREQDLRFAHITENYLENPRQDPYCILPLEALAKLEAEGGIGEVAPEVFSCMGGIYSQRRVREELIPALDEAFTKQEIDVALLVPM